MKQYVKLGNVDVPFNGKNVSFSLTKKEVKLLTTEAQKNESVKKALNEGILIKATEQEFVAAGGKV